MKNNLPGLLLTGPVTLILLLAVLAAYVLLLVIGGRLTGLISLGTGAETRLRRGRLLPVLWGLAATLLVMTLAAVLFKIKALALLGVGVLVVGVVLAGVAVCVAALRVGGRLALELALPGASPVASLLLGVAALLLASFVPVVGWVLVGLLAAGGLGAVLEEMFSRR